MKFGFNLRGEISCENDYGYRNLMLYLSTSNSMSIKGDCEFESEFKKFKDNLKYVCTWW